MTCSVPKYHAEKGWHNTCSVCSTGYCQVCDGGCPFTPKHQEDDRKYR